MTVHTFQASATIPAPLEEVFGFFSRAENLQKLTPKHLHFQILTPLPIEMKPGAIIEYRLRLFGISFRWQTEITVWEEGVRFVDVQKKGPYRLWEHEHRFSAQGDSTLMEDHLRYSISGGPLEPAIHAIFVRKQIESIFSFRNSAIERVFRRSSDNQVPSE